MFSSVFAIEVICSPLSVDLTMLQNPQLWITHRNYYSQQQQQQPPTNQHHNHNHNHHFLHIHQATQRHHGSALVRSAGTRASAPTTRQENRTLAAPSKHASPLSNDLNCKLLKETSQNISYKKQLKWRGCLLRKPFGKKKECPPLLKKNTFPIFSQKTSFESLSPQLPKLWPSLQKIPHKKVTPLGSWELKVPERWMIGMDGMVQSSCRLESGWIVVWPHFGWSFCWVTLEGLHHVQHF